MQIHDSSPMSQRAYAQRRGVSHVAVQRAIKAGRLVQSVRDGKIIDPDLADREWAANTDYTEAPAAVIGREAARAAALVPPRPPAPAEPDASPPIHLGSTMSEVNIAEKFWKAKQAELKFRTESGELVEREKVRGKLEDVFRACRAKLLGVPTRARQALPHLTLADVAMLEDLVRETLEDLSGEAVA